MKIKMKDKLEKTKSTVCELDMSGIRELNRVSTIE